MSESSMPVKKMRYRALWTFKYQNTQLFAKKSVNILSYCKIGGLIFLMVQTRLYLEIVHICEMQFQQISSQGHHFPN
jgi:hypothetical protein